VLFDYWIERTGALAFVSLKIRYFHLFLPLKVYPSAFKQDLFISSLLYLSIDRFKMGLCHQK
jgi:hypothetical protein